VTQSTLDVSDPIVALKAVLRERFSSSRLPRLRSLFLIGSTSAGTETARKSYHDVDVHLVMDSICLGRSELDYVRESLHEICAEFSGETVLAAWGLRDRHWKLVPDPTRAINLSIHATLANRLDYQRRVVTNPVLAWNMYQLCEVLVGDHPASILPLRRPSALDLIHGAGGIGWMAENFYRALWLHLASPDQQEFFPYIAGYCWNAANSVMLHYYTLVTGLVSTRREAQDYLLHLSAFPKHLRRGVEMLDSHKYVASVDESVTRELINAAAGVIAWVAAFTIERLQLAQSNNLRKPDIWQRDLYSSGLSACVGRRLDVQEVHVKFGHQQGEFYESFRSMFTEVRASFPNASSEELFEFLAKLTVTGGSERFTKLYVWSQWNVFRLLLSPDFAFSRSQPTLESALWGWENGCQALLQRLHERYVCSGPGPTTDSLARLSVAIATNQLEAIGIKPPTGPGRTYEQACQFFERILKPVDIVCEGPLG